MTIFGTNGRNTFNKLSLPAPSPSKRLSRYSTTTRRFTTPIHSIRIIIIITIRATHLTATLLRDLMFPHPSQPAPLPPRRWNAPPPATPSARTQPRVSAGATQTPSTSAFSGVSSTRGPGATPTQAATPTATPTPALTLIPALTPTPAPTPTPATPITISPTTVPTPTTSTTSPPPPQPATPPPATTTPNPEDAEYPLDNDALESIFSAANEIFFNGRLSQRVAWDWSHASSSRYDSRVIGTTALRRAAAHTRGFETLIVLSASILRGGGFSRRLLIKGEKGVEWGSGSGWGQVWGAPPNVYPCSGMAAEQEEYAAAPGSAAAVAAFPGPVTQEMVYFGTGGGGNVPVAGQEAVHYARGSPSPRPGTPTREMVYFGRGSPSPRPGTPTREMVQYGDRGLSSSGSNGSNVWWRHRRAGRPLYVYSGDKPSPSYVYTHPTGQRP
ncbi:hypothetical protein CHGG_01782 [Chaetomium globosum CBS 148.51]|uniref:Uncharacterized protein n=1 Tax=Chaetomium globosum (strain ATCC 6205 / CBS 148.51 / DSM 1962 / NBRC 6347 / NRRL 1970) TaxID=306901 RepID=Q2HDC2_CHAGB|nr:uncharacterized protein CHGG_01782 [Chaetomium globosum CBS 148.51]EAQ93547.1 hypothetical protein CHGG_01782 [Chaetomium globosum CBS 148.51]